jgi:transcriptional regulator
MYIPEHFREQDRHAAMAVIAANPFATLVGHAAEPVISHVPIIPMDPDGEVFEGHVARANPMSDLILEGAPLTAVFVGPHAYVSPTWYETPGLVPTWNFVAVHVTGRSQPIRDRDSLASLVENLSDLFERDRDDPWVPDYPAAMLDAIVGFRIRAERFEAKFKLSQNRGAVDRDAVAAALSTGGPGAREVAALMRAQETSA